MVYNFILNCWKLGKITKNDVESFVTKGFITEDEAAEIDAACPAPPTPEEPTEEISV